MSVVYMVLGVIIIFLPCVLLVMGSLMSALTMGLNSTGVEDIWDGNNTTLLILTGIHVLITIQI